MKRVLLLLYGLVGYASFLGALAYLALFLADLVPRSVDRGAGPLGPPLLVDVLLAAALGAQHGLMARPAFRRWLARRIPAAGERSTRMLASAAMLVLLFWLWRPLPALLWSVEHPAAAGALWGLYWGGWLLAAASTLASGRAARRPLHAGLLLALWATPRMTVGHLVLSLAATAYVLAGLAFPRSWAAPRRALRPALLAGAVLLLGAAVAAVAREEPERDASPRRPLARETLEVGGLTRSFAYHVPAPAPVRPALLFAFHGSGGDAERMRAFTGRGLERLADRHGFVVVYPEAFRGSWNVCRAREPVAANRLDVDDVGFVQALVWRFARTHGADPGRVYALGYSGGGHMAYRLALETPDEVRAVAAVAASLPEEGEMDCRPAGRPVPVMVVAGTADGISPYRGGEAIGPAGTVLGRVRPAPETAAYFARLAGYGGDADRRELLPRARPGGSSVERSVWMAPGTPEVVLYTVRGGGHSIPGPRTALPSLVGPTERRFDALEQAVAFFLRQPRAGPGGAEPAGAVIPR